MSIQTSNSSIEGLRIYRASRQLEDAVYEAVKLLPTTEFYQLGNDLRRSSAGISHYVTEAHRRYSYGMKLETLHLARTETETLRKLLQTHAERGFGNTKALQADCTAIVKQIWGLIKYLKRRQAEREHRAQITATDHLVAARA